MEQFIFLIVLVIIIVSNFANIRKKMKTSPPGQKPPAKAGWKKYVRDIWAEMQPQAGQETAHESGGRRPSGWEDLMGKPPAGEPEPAGEAEAPRQQAAEPSRAARRQTLIESRVRQGRTPEARIGEAERRAPAPPVPGMAATRGRRRRCLDLSGESLRRAVIWYEVLGPPMSLRDPEREMWL